MKISDLWIGDFVYYLPTSQKAVFEGITENNQIKIKIGFDVMIVDQSTIKEFDESKELKPAIVIEENSKKEAIIPVGDSIDLHLEVLDPSGQIIPVRALDFQIGKLKTYLKHARLNKLNRVMIVHGKGNGVLKQAVVAVLETTTYVTSFSDQHDGGAQMVKINW